MMEFYTVHSIGMSESDYSFVSFKEAEKALEESDS
jgi:hypothetical protein